MFKNRNLTYLRIEQILTITVFLFMIYLKRELIINSFENQVELKSNSFISKNKNDSKNYNNEFSMQKLKSDFSTQVSLLILIMIWGTLMLLNLQRRINREKNKSIQEK